jgi:hypothetical protein
MENAYELFIIEIETLCNFKSEKGLKSRSMHRSRYFDLFDINKEDFFRYKLFFPTSSIKHF